MHVALVGGLGVEDVGAHARAAGLGGDEGHGDGAEAHAAPFGGEVRVPEAELVGALTEADDGGDEAVAVSLVLA